MSACPTCGRENAADARFCGNCGASLLNRVGVEERRHVTALFADLVGSTGLGERLDPEVMRSIVGHFFEVATEIVRRNGGNVEKFAGDSVLALFGLTVSHEDDAERAVRAGLLIRDGIPPLAADAGERHGISVQVRIGAESGEVVVGDPFGGATMATGDVLNVAARLEQAAEPGEIIVGNEAYLATRTAIRYEPIGQRALRGRDSTIAAWRAIEAETDLGGTRGVPGLHAPLTGRDDELALLLGAQRRAVTERKAVLFTLIGVPGIGKSRLVREFAESVEAGGTRIVRGRCLPYGEGITYWPMAEIVREIAGVSPDMGTDDATAALAAVVNEPGVAERIGFAIGLVTEPPTGAEGVEREIAWAFRRFIESVAAVGPLVLVFEDIHWGEPALLDLIEYLATWVRGVPLLLLCTSRPEFLDRRSAWGAGRIESSRIALEPLDQAHASTLLAALLDIDELPKPLRDRVLERAEGNPLFVEEVVRMLIDRGILIHRDGRWVAAPEANDVAVPESVEAIIRARLDTLPRPERALLQVASVVGRIFERSAVATLIDDGEPIEPRLDDAVLRDLVTEEPVSEPSYRFKHILIRDVAYASLPKSRRADLHARVAEWLAGWSADRTDEVADICAYHLEQAVRLGVEVQGRVDPAIWRQALDALTASCDRASDREDFRAQESFASRALALPGGTEPKSLDLRWRLVDARYRQTDILGTQELAPDLARDAREAGRPEIEGRARLATAAGLWVSTQGGEGFEPAREELERSLELLTAAGDRRYQFDAEFLYGYVGWWRGDLAEAYDGWERARATARELGDPGREAIALARLAAVRRNQARLEEAGDLYDQALLLAEQSGSRGARAQVTKSFGDHIAVTRTNAEAMPLLRGSLALYEDVGDREGLASVLMSIGSGLAEDGAVDEGIAALRRAAMLFDEIGHGGYLPEAERELAFWLIQSGDLADAELHALRGVEIVAPDDWATVASTRMVLGRVRAAQMRDEEAEALLRGAIEVIEKTDYQASESEEYLALAEFLLERGRSEEGEALGAKARALALMFGAESRSVTWIDGRLAAARARGAQ